MVTFHRILPSASGFDFVYTPVPVPGLPSQVPVHLPDLALEAAGSESVHDGLQPKQTVVEGASIQCPFRMEPEATPSLRMAAKKGVGQSCTSLLFQPFQNFTPRRRAEPGTHRALRGPSCRHLRLVKSAGKGQGLPGR